MVMNLIRGRERGSRYILSILVWLGWIVLFCAIILVFEVATGYISLTGTTSNPAFVAFMLVMIAALSLARPEIPFLLAVFFMPLLTMAFPGISFVRGHLADMEIAHPMIFGAILGWTVRALRRGDPIVEGSPLTVPIALFLGWAALSLNWCVNPKVGKWELLDIFFALVIYVTATKIIRSREILDRVIKVWILSGILLTGLGFYFIMTGAAARVDVMSGAPTHFSFEMNLIIVLVIAMLYIKGSKFMSAWILWPLLICMFYVNLRTGSRAGLFSLIAALFYFFFSYHSINKDRKHTSLILFLVVVLLAGAIFLLAYNPMEGFKIGFRVYNPLEFSEEDTFQFRLEIWNVAWNYIRVHNRYIQGLGILSFILLTKAEYGVYGHAHSIYINIGVNYGLVGLLIFAWIIVAIVLNFRDGMRAAHRKYYQVLLRAMAAGLLAFAIHGIVDFYVWHMRSLWLYLGVAMSAVRLVRQEGQQKEGAGDEGGKNSGKST